MRITVKVKPNAKKDEIKKIDTDYYEVRVTVVPEKGKANKRVVEILSKHFKIPKSKIKLVRGETSREKVFEILND
ncbi:DUF167 domain-containing protein [Persephonella sp.]|uniref:DUF167 domain-containing protein n=1 Tax=Persephonella sp. TaxID=2060922 RepID=UPI0025E29EDD|nr:DUF167 domain-containing protein [Persephonella sp.]